MPNQTQTITMKGSKGFLKVYVVDIRGDGQVAQLQGWCNIPVSTALLDAGQRIKWNVDQLQQPLEGVTCDITDKGFSIVFLVAEKINVKTVKGKFLSFKQIVDLVKKYEPQLREVEYDGAQNGRI